MKMCTVDCVLVRFFGPARTVTLKYVGREHVQDANEVIYFHIKILEMIFEMERILGFHCE